MSGRGPNGYFSQKGNKDLYQAAQDMGIDSNKYYEEDSGSQGEFDYKGFEKDVLRAYNNNYDVRRTIEAAKLSGYKGAEDLSDGIDSLERLNAASAFMRDVHDEHIGGKFGWSRDAHGVTDYMVNRDRDIITDDINGLKEQLLDQALGEAKPDDNIDPDKPVEYSDRAGGANARLEAAANNPDSLYYNDPGRYHDKNNESVSRNDDAKDATRSFFDQTKFNLAQGLNLQEDIAGNLQRAATATYLPTKFNK